MASDPCRTLSDPKVATLVVSDSYTAPESALKLPRHASVKMPSSLRARGQVVAFQRLQGEERKQAALPVLRSALELVREGWCQGAPEDGTGRVSLYGALMKGTIEAEYAREVLREVLREWDLVAWNDHPSRRKADVVRALLRAVARAGRHLRRGGWTVVSR